MNKLSITLTVYGFFASASIAMAADKPIIFEDVAQKTGIAKYLEENPKYKDWRYGHGAGWGDVNGDGKPDLYIGAFAARKWYQGEDAPIPNWLFINNGSGGFTPAGQEHLQALGRDARCAGVLFADLDNDGDLDLLVANHVSKPNHQGSKLFENQGNGNFREVTPPGDPWPARIGMRNASAIDFNNDGMLDLVIADGTYGQGEAKAKLIILENKGGFKFEDATARLGLPESNTSGLGLAIGDVNQDNILDIFVAGSNRLFVSKEDGKYIEAHPGRFAMPTLDKGGDHCGAVFGDLNGDDLLDLVTTEHGVPARMHIYVNKGIKDGIPDLVEVSDTLAAGKVFPTGTEEDPIKATHVAIEDMDNDGKPDLFLAAVYKDDNGVIQPVVLKNLSAKGGDLKLSDPPFDQMIGYYAPAPVADYDRDGRLDIFMCSWFPLLRNSLFHNITEGGNWLTVAVEGKGANLNPMGIGAIVRVYEAGHSGDPRHQLGRHDIVVGTGYASTEEAVGHFGLGQAKEVDVEVTWGAQKIQQANVAANQMLTIPFGK